MIARTSLLHVLVVLTIAAAPAAQQASRDGPGRAAFGTAAISGTLVSDDDEKRPIRRAVMTLSGAELGQGRMAVTDDQGRFLFPDLPAGRYTLNGTRPAYVTSYYGARQSWRGPSSTIALADGQQLAVAMRMLHGAVVAGTLFDSLGRPQPNARVMAVRFRMNAGERVVQTAGGVPVITDDRGAYRVYGLAPGEYAVTASVQGNADVRQITAPEIQWAQQQIQRGGQATPGGPSAWIGGPPPPPGPSLGYAPVFYPGTADPGGATVLTIGPGEVREGIDFPLQFVATSRVEGTIVDVDGRPVTAAILNLLAKRIIPLLTPMGGASSRTDNAGKFSFAGVLPGDYTLVARAQSGPPAPLSRAGGAPTRPLVWAQQDLSVSGSDVTGLGLRLQPGLSVSGRVTFEGTTAPPSDLTKIRVSLGPVQNGGTSVLVGDPQMNADGTFTFQGATPGRYRVSASVQQALIAAPGAPAATNGPTWSVKSVVSNGIDTLDSALEITTADVSGIVITFTDRPTELSGRLLDAAGRPAPEYSVVAFSSDRTFWTLGSRRLRTARPDSEGKFQMLGLPPGEYCLVALTDLDQADLADPAFLEQLAAASIKITLAEGEKKKQDLKLSGGSPD
jgi:uncharacterized protein (DUF2141 family)